MCCAFNRDNADTIFKVSISSTFYEQSFWKSYSYDILLNVFWWAQFGYLYFFIKLSRILVWELILAWLWYHIHLVGQARIRTHDPHNVCRVCYPLDQAFSRKAFCFTNRLCSYFWAYGYCWKLLIWYWWNWLKGIQIYTNH